VEGAVVTAENPGFRFLLNAQPLTRMNRAKPEAQAVLQ
jgi:hypothetical protein